MDKTALAIGGGVVVLLGLITTSVISNLAWAPHAENIRIEELRVQITCIQQGGIYDGYGKCQWSKS